MTQAAVRIVTPDAWRRWVEGFGILPVEVAIIGREHWAVATELLYDTTQQAVHIISADLKSSGRYRTRRTGLVVNGDVLYGGTYESEGFVDYAIAEQERGGDHAYLSRGWEKAEYRFSQAMPETWKDVVHTWR